MKISSFLGVVIVGFVVSGGCAARGQPSSGGNARMLGHKSQHNPIQRFGPGGIMTAHTAAATSAMSSLNTDHQDEFYGQPPRPTMAVTEVAYERP